MVRKKKIESSPTVTDKPALDVSKIPVEIGSKTYNLCFEFIELGKAETWFRSLGHRFNLLFALPNLTLENIGIVFACAAHKHHPELTWEEAQALVTMESAYPIATAIVMAWDRSGAKSTVPAPVGGES